MKSTQLLSVVFSLIMFTGVTAGNTAFAESDDIDDILEDFCEMTLDERSDVISKYDLDEYAEKLAIICDIEDKVDRENSLDSVIDAIYLETDVYDETYDDFDDIIEDFEDCVESGYPIMKSLPEQCMTDDGTVFTNTDNDSDVDDDRYEDDFDLDDLLDRYCEISTDKKRQLLADHPRLAPFTDRLTNYCDLSEDEQDAIYDLIEEHGDKIRSELRDYAKDYRVDHERDMRIVLDKYCGMTDTEKKAYVAEHDKAADHDDKMNLFCALTDEDSRRDFIQEYKAEYMTYMKDKMSDKMHDKMTDKKHMDYDRLCAMADSERAAEIDDSELLDRISKWCQMTPEERKEYKKDHIKDTVKDHIKDKFSHMEFDRFCKMTDSELASAIFDAEFVDRASKWCVMTPDERADYKKDIMKDRMSNVAKDKIVMKLSDKSDRLKAMIMNKHDISDERRDEIKQKFIEKHGDLTDKKKSELKMKFKDHMKRMDIKISDERKSAIHDRLAEMKAFKADLRERSSDLTVEEKQELRAQFIEKAKDMQLAWINPRVQMTAGIDAAEVECREGFSLVMKASNGVAMCLKADTALKMIDRGQVVPTN